MKKVIFIVTGAVSAITLLAFAVGHSADSLTMPLPIKDSKFGHDVTPEMAKDATERTGARTIDFSTTTTDGTRWNLEEHVAKKPVILFFVEKNCPCCVGAKPFVERVRHAYEGHVDMLAIVNSNSQVSAKWGENVTALFPIAPDPQLELIHKLKIKSGAYTLLITQSASGEPKIDQIFPGYSREMMEKLGQAISRAAVVTPVKIDTFGAPDKIVAGCDFEQTTPKAS